MMWPVNGTSINNGYSNSDSHRKREIHEGGEDDLWTQNTPAIVVIHARSNELFTQKCSFYMGLGS